jgi:hypothetical protein
MRDRTKVNNAARFNAPHLSDEMSAMMAMGRWNAMEVVNAVCRLGSRSNRIRKVPL